MEFIVLDRDVTEAFSDAKAVNAALRILARRGARALTDSVGFPWVKRGARGTSGRRRS